MLDRPYAEVLTAAKRPQPPQMGGRTGRAASADASFGAYSMPVGIVEGQWVIGRAGVNPGSIASWNIYPDTGWVGVILGNHDDDVPFREIIQRERQAVLGPRAGK